MVRAVGFEPTLPFGKRIFVPTTAFAAVWERAQAFVVWTIPSPWRLGAAGAARLVSTPSPVGAWLGIAISQGSPNLSSSTSRVSPRAPNPSSPLRLPISPRPHDTNPDSNVSARRQAMSRVHRVAFPVGARSQAVLRECVERLGWRPCPRVGRRSRVGSAWTAEDATELRRDRGPRDRNGDDVFGGRRRRHPMRVRHAPVNFVGRKSVGRHRHDPAGSELNGFPIRHCRGVLRRDHESYHRQSEFGRDPPGEGVPTPSKRFRWDRPAAPRGRTPSRGPDSPSMPSGT